MLKMATRRREGLRILLMPAKVAKKQNNAAHCKTYREQMKDDPGYREKNKEKCKHYRQRQQTDEQIAAQREAGRLRTQKYRELKKCQAASRAGPLMTSTPKATPKPKTRKAIDAQRQKWKEEKQKQRSAWTSQKWRRHRERCKAYYESCKEPALARREPALARRKDPPEGNQILTQECHSTEAAPTQHETSGLESLPEQTAERACSTDALSPSPKTLKKAYKDQIEKLNPKRSKKALFVKRILHGLALNKEMESIDTANLYKCKESSTSKIVVDFLEDNGVCLPTKKSVSKRSGIQKKILPKRLKTLCKDFTEINPLNKVSLRTFYRKKPKHILSSKSTAYQQCLCEICTNVDLKLDVLNVHVSEQFDGRDALSEASLCAEPTDNCLERVCDECGVKKVRVRLMFKGSPGVTVKVKWRSWDMVEKENKAKRRELVFHETSLEILRDKLLSDLGSFSKHLAVFRWQHFQFKSLKANLPSSWALTVYDFAENFLCQYQEEVQSAHWGYNQVTVHPCVLFYACNLCGGQVNDYLIFLSDDLLHDAHIVKVFHQQTVDYLKSNINNLEKVVTFSDGCAAQYKSKVPFHHIASDESTVAFERCFFGSHHGKSQCDAAGGVVKRLVDEDIRTGAVIQSASAMYAHCTTYFTMAPSDANVCCHVRRSFRLITSDQIDRSLDSSTLQTLPGTRQIHSIKRLSENVVATRKKTCFCDSCIRGILCAIPWEIKKLKGPSKLGSIPNQSPVETREEGRELLEESREVCFGKLLDKMGLCQTFESLVRVIQESQPAIACHQLPDVLPKTIIDVAGVCDRVAEVLKPHSIGNHLFPVLTGADGNCLPRSLSTLVFGSENHHIEMRCRIIEELVAHKYSYIHGEMMGGPDISAKVASLSDAACNANIDCHDTPQIGLVFDKEVMSISHRDIPMGLWQLAAAANVAGMAIKSVYPNKGWYRGALFNRVLVPRSAKSADMLHIMWSATRTDMIDSNWVANHFVPLMPITESTASHQDTSHLNVAFCNDTVEVNDFFRVDWEGKEYIAQVREVDDETRLAMICFMTEKKGMYVWPLKDDLSWESFDALKEKVCLELDLATSNQRVQYFRLKH